MRDKDYILIENILKCISKISEYTKQVSYEEFSKNTMLVEACVFNLSQIGEYANKVSTEFQKEHSDIPWRMMYGLRNRIVHDYEGVKLVLIWDIISNDLAGLQEQLKQIR